ncbi:hypothetical protein Tco_0970329 [Tanacetum coccineum]
MKRLLNLSLDPGKTLESRPPPKQVFMDEDQAGPDPKESCVALARPNPEPTHDEFMANVYPNIQESLKFPANKHVILEDPLSSSGTFSSMKNLDDAYSIGDQFLNDKSTKDEPRKLNVEVEVVSMVTVPIYQASSSVPPLSTTVIDLSPPKLVPSTTQVPIFTALEKKFFDFKQKSNTLDNTTQNLRSRVFTLEIRDLPYKINQIVNEVVKEAVQVALQALLKDCFRELPKADMKEILHQRMFESGTYKSLPKHVALYKALEASMERANRDGFFVEKDKSCKRRRDDQDPPPPPLDSNPSKKRRHAFDASSSTQPLASQSLAWKTSNTREAPSSSSRQNSAPSFKQPVEDVPIPDDVNISGSEDTDNAHLPKIKTRPDWLEPIPKEDGPATPKPDWVIPPNELPKTKNNWANALASSYQDPDEYKLLRQTGNMSSFINWFCKRIGKKKPSKADLEGPAFKIESERDYDISAAYGISHWWFKRKEFYIIRNSAPSDHSKVRSYMWILSVVSLKTLERYGYTYLKEIVLRRADYKEYKILEADFKNLHPNDFEDLYLLHLQGQLNHLSGADKVHLFNAVNLWIRNIVIKKHVEDLQLRIESYQTKLNLTQPDWDASDFLFKEDYTIVSKPRAIIYRDRNDQKKMIMETRIWSEDDRRKSKDFMEVIEKRLKIRRIFRSLESFVGGRLRDVDYRLIQRTK